MSSCHRITLALPVTCRWRLSQPRFRPLPPFDPAKRLEDPCVIFPFLFDPMHFFSLSGNPEVLVPLPWRDNAVRLPLPPVGEAPNFFFLSASPPPLWFLIYIEFFPPIANCPHPLLPSPPSLPERRTTPFDSYRVRDASPTGISPSFQPLLFSQPQFGHPTIVFTCGFSSVSHFFFTVRARRVSEMTQFFPPLNYEPLVFCPISAYSWVPFGASRTHRFPFGVTLKTGRNPLCVLGGVVFCSVPAPFPLSFDFFFANGAGC